MKWSYRPPNDVDYGASVAAKSSSVARSLKFSKFLRIADKIISMYTQTTKLDDDLKSMSLVANNAPSTCAYYN